MQGNTPATSHLPTLRQAIGGLQNRPIDKHGKFYRTSSGSLAFEPAKPLDLPSLNKKESSKAESDLHKQIRRTETALNLRGLMVVEMAQKKPNYDKVLELAGQMLEQDVNPKDLNWDRGTSQVDDKESDASRPTNKVLENLPGLMKRLSESKKATPALVAVFTEMEDGLKKGSKAAASSSSQSAQAPKGQPLPRSATTTTTTTTTTTSSNAVAPLTPRTAEAMGWSKAGTERFKKEAELQSLLKEKAGLEKLTRTTWGHRTAPFMTPVLDRQVTSRLKEIDALMPSFEGVAQRRAARATPVMTTRTPVTTTTTTATTALTTTTATTTGPSLTTAGPQPANAGDDGLELLDIALALLDRLIDRDGLKKGREPINDFSNWLVVKDRLVTWRDSEIRRRTTDSGPVPTGQPSKIDKLDARIARQQEIVRMHALTVGLYDSGDDGVTVAQRDRAAPLLEKAMAKIEQLRLEKDRELEAINSAANASNTTTTTTTTLNTPRGN